MGSWLATACQWAESQAQQGLSAPNVAIICDCNCDFLTQVKKKGSIFGPRKGPSPHKALRFSLQRKDATDGDNRDAVCFLGGGGEITSSLGLDRLVGGVLAQPPPHGLPLGNGSTSGKLSDALFVYLYEVFICCSLFVCPSCRFFVLFWSGFPLCFVITTINRVYITVHQDEYEVSFLPPIPPPPLCVCPGLVALLVIRLVSGWVGPHSWFAFLFFSSVFGVFGWDGGSFSVFFFFLPLFFPAACSAVHCFQSFRMGEVDETSTPLCYHDYVLGLGVVVVFFLY